MSCAIAIGVVGAGLFAPANTTATAAPWKIAVVLVAVGALALLPYALRAIGRNVAGLTIFCAGCGFAWSGIATKLAANDFKTGYVLTAILWAASTALASGVGTLSEMSSLQSRPAIQVAPVVFVTQTVIPVIVAPVLFGEYFDETPLDGWPLVASLLVLVAGAGALARSPLLLAMMDPQRVSAPSDSTDSPRAESSETMPLEPEHRFGRPVHGDDEHVARADPALRQRRRRVQLHRALDGRGVVGARQHELPDGQPAGGLHVVEAVVEPERLGLLVEHRAGLDPAQRRGARDFGQKLVAELAQLGDPLRGRHAGVVGEGDVDAAFGQLVGEDRDAARRRAHDHGDRVLVGLHVRERAAPAAPSPRGVVTSSVESIQLPSARISATWVATATSRRRQRGIGRTRRGAESTTSAAAGSAGAGERLGLSASGGEARLDVFAQLVGVVGQEQQVERRHLARVQPGVADGQAV